MPRQRPQNLKIPPATVPTSHHRPVSVSLSAKGSTAAAEASMIANDLFGYPLQYNIYYSNIYTTNDPNVIYIHGLFGYNPPNPKAFSSCHLGKIVPLFQTSSR